MFTANVSQVLGRCPCLLFSHHCFCRLQALRNLSSVALVSGVFHYLTSFERVLVCHGPITNPPGLLCYCGFKRPHISTNTLFFSGIQINKPIFPLLMPGHFHDCQTGASGWVSEVQVIKHGGHEAESERLGKKKKKHGTMKKLN